MTISYRINVNTLRDFEKLSLILSSCNPLPRVPSLETDDKE